MICSRNEVAVMLRKAAIGSGFPVGVADDLAAAGGWLCARRLEGFGAVMDAIATEFGPESDWWSENTTVHMTDTSVARFGSSPFELLVAKDIEQVVLHRPDAPLLLVGLAGIVAQANETTFALSVGVDSPIIVSSESVMWGDALSLDCVENIDITEVHLTEVDQVGDESAPSPSPPRAVEVDERQWAVATELASRTYVPATEESRVRGAGAGLGDND